MQRKSLSSSAAIAVLLLVAACTTAPERTIPDPLPETLAWATASMTPASGEGAFLGLEVRENDSGSLEELTFAPGVRVHKVVPNSPAAAAGIEVEDIVLRFEDVEVLAPEDLDTLLADRSGDAPASLEIQRGDTVFEVDVQLAAAGGGSVGHVEELYVLDPARSRAAWATGRGASGRGGAVLVARPDDGPSGSFELRTIIYSVNGEDVHSGRALVRRLLDHEPGARVELEYETPEGQVDRRWIRLLTEGEVLTRFSVPVVVTYDRTPEGDRTMFVLLDLWIISLFRYERDGGEQRWRVLRFFQWSTGVGELDE